MAKITKDEIIRAVYNELERSTDYATAELADVRQRAWNYFLNRPRGDEIAGRSTVQDTSVRDTVHAMLAAIMPAYAGDSIVSFEPHGPNDVDAAEAESRAVNALFTETNQGYLELCNAVQDALLFRNGVIKIWIEEDTEVSTRRFRAAPADVLAQAREAYPDQEWEYIESVDGLAEFKVTADTKRLRTEAIEQALLFLDPNQRDQNLTEGKFIAETFWPTRSELIGMGVSKKIVKDLPNSQDQAITELGSSNSDVLARYIGQVSPIGDAATPDQDEILCHWVHMQMDRDGDGTSEKYRFLVSDRQILLDDPVDFFPYASGTGWPVPHRWSGLGVYDLLRITQDEMTNARRQLADNLNVANNQRPIFDPGTTETEDITNGAPGRGIRSTDPSGVHWMPVQDIVSQSTAYLQYMSSVRADQAGSALDMQSPDAQLLSTASGISAEMQLAPRELMAAHVSRNIAETLIRNLFLLIHRTLRSEWADPIMYQLAGDWQETSPMEWQPRNRLNVNVGLSPGERRRKSAALQQVQQIQMSMIQGGTANITTNWKGVHSSIMDWLNSVEVTGGDVYFLNPDGQESQAGQQAQGQQQQAQGQQQAQMMQQQMELEQMKVQIDGMKVENDKTKAEEELRWKYFDTILDNDAKAEQLESNERTSERAAETDNGDSARGNDKE